MPSMFSIRNKYCKECPLHETVKTVCVMGTGSFKRPVFIVGEAPGYQEDQMGRPFVGRSGKLLRSELIRVGINPEQTYLTNAVKCFPEGTPTEEEIHVCSGLYLRKEIEELRPEWILTVGSSSFRTLTKSKETISNARAKVWDDKLAGVSLVFPTFHPAYILRRSDELETFRGDLELFATIITL